MVFGKKLEILKYTKPYNIYIYIYNYYYINGIISNLNIYVICAPMYIN